MKRIPECLSINWFAALPVFLLHAVVTYLLGLVLFAFAMGSFTHGPGAVCHVTAAIMWIWNPVVMLMVHGHLPAGNTPEIWPMLWSLFVGLLAGVLSGSYRKTRESAQVSPSGNPDLVGTPWEHDSGFNPDRKQFSLPIHQAEQAGSGKSVTLPEPERGDNPQTESDGRSR